jgi:hypothetical protein
MGSKQKRTRCSNSKFLDAVFSSKTYLEISSKTGQKTATTITRYNKLKDSMDLPVIERKKRNRLKQKDIDSVKSIVLKLKEYYY